MMNGKYSQEEMIKSVDKGIFAVSLVEDKLILLQENLYSIALKLTKL
jgi:predicted Zn-dependent protease